MGRRKHDKCAGWGGWGGDKSKWLIARNGLHFISLVLHIRHISQSTHLETVIDIGNSKYGEVQSMMHKCISFSQSFLF